MAELRLMIEGSYRRDISLAWYTAAFSRQIKLTPLVRLFAAPGARILKGDEAKRRRREHEELVAIARTSNAN